MAPNKQLNYMKKEMQITNWKEATHCQTFSISNSFRMMADHPVFSKFDYSGLKGLALPTTANTWTTVSFDVF